MEINIPETMTLRSGGIVSFEGNVGVVRPAVHPLLRWFDSSHLPEHLRTVVAPFAALATELARQDPCAERTVAIRKLLESKDAAVRAAVADHEA